MNLLQQMLPGMVWDPGLLARMLPGTAPDPVDAAAAGIPVEMGVGFVPVPGPHGLPGEVAGTLAWSQVTDKPTAFVPTRYEHLQSLPSAIWTIQHNLGRYPQVTVIDSAGEQVWSTVQYPDVNTVLVISGAPTTGRAELI